MEGRTISKVRRVPVGRKWASMEVFERVLWTPFATAARLFCGPPEAGGRVGSDGGRGGGLDGYWTGSKVLGDAV